MSVRLPAASMMLFLMVFTVYKGRLCMLVICVYSVCMYMRCYVEGMKLARLWIWVMY